MTSPLDCPLLTYFLWSQVLHALGQVQPKEMVVKRVKFSSAPVMREYFTNVERLPAVVYARDEETAG